ALQTSAKPHPRHRPPTARTAPRQSGKQVPNNRSKTAANRPPRRWPKDAESKFSEYRGKPLDTQARCGGPTSCTEESISRTQTPCHAGRREAEKPGRAFTGTPVWLHQQDKSVTCSPL